MFLNNRFVSEKDENINKFNTRVEFKGIAGELGQWQSTRLCMHTHTYSQTHDKHARIDRQTYAHTHTYVHIHIHTCPQVQTHIYRQRYAHAYTCICTQTYPYVHTHKHKHTQTTHTNKYKSGIII